MNEKPVVQLTGESGNAFMILALCRKAMQKAGWTKDAVDAVIAEMQSSDYDHLLQTAMTHLDVR